MHPAPAIDPRSPTRRRPAPRAHAAAGAAAGRPARRRAAARSERLDLRADRDATTRRSAPTAAALRPRHLPEPARGDHRRADDGRLRLGRHAGELPPLELRQGVHRQREELPARPDGPGLRDRHQLRPLHQLPDGGEHDGDAGAGDRPRRLRPQQLLQGQLPVPHVDRCVVDHRLPGLRARTTSPSARSATACEAVEDTARHLPRADELRRRPLPPAAARSRSPRSRRAASDREAYAQPQVNDIWRTLPQARRARRAKPTRPSASRPSRRRTSSTSSRRTRRCSSPGSARSCASCARSRSTSIRSARPR